MVRTYEDAVIVFSDGSKQETNLDIIKEVFVKKMMHLEQDRLSKGAESLFSTEDSSITWNGETLTKKQLQENYDHIIDFNPNTIGNGYDCSVCDPFLLLVCYLFNVNIDHNYNGYLMKYRANNNARILRFSSNTGHFQVA